MRYAMDDARRVPMSGAMDGAMRSALTDPDSPEARVRNPELQMRTGQAQITRMTQNRQGLG